MSEAVQASSAAVLAGGQAPAADPGVSGAPTPQAAPAGPASQAASISWLPGADEQTVGYIQNKGWESPDQLLAAYRGAEKFISAPISQRAVIPGPDAKPAEWDAFYDRIGRPSDPTGYKIEVPEGIGDPDFAKAAQAKMHELGFTQKQGEALAAWWNEHATGMVASSQQKAAEDFRAQDQALRTEWGNAFTQNLAVAQAAARALGLEAEAIDKLQAALGHHGTMNLLYKIGAKSGEADFVTGMGSTGFGDRMTPAQAKAEIKTLSQDRNFVARLMNKDAEASARWAKLHSEAYPDGD